MFIFKARLGLFHVLFHRSFRFIWVYYLTTRKPLQPGERPVTPTAASPRRWQVWRRSGPRGPAMRRLIAHNTRPSRRIFCFVSCFQGPRSTGGAARGWPGPLGNVHELAGKGPVPQRQDPVWAWIIPPPSPLPPSCPGEEPWPRPGLLHVSP